MHWPEGFDADDSLRSYIDVCVRHLGFSQCATTDLSFDPKFHKIALFADENDEFTHAMRQVDEIHWTSKIGIYIDVQHTLDGLRDSKYGSLAAVLRKELSVISGEQ